MTLYLPMDPQPPEWSKPVMFAVYVDPPPLMPGDKYEHRTVKSVEPVMHDGRWQWKVEVEPAVKPKEQP